MKILFFDCTNGISGDMVLKALMDLSGSSEEIVEAVENEKFSVAEDFSAVEDFSTGKHIHRQDHTHGRSYERVRKLIHQSSFSSHAKDTALAIYGHIAKAEAQVHGATMETVHFHEVGRDEAIKNALGIGMALQCIAPDEILTSPIYDGKGTVICSHGEIPVPVPAVMALRESCDFEFETADVNMEMVTPSGLASLMGMGAKPTSTDNKTASSVVDQGNSGDTSIPAVVTNLGHVVRQTEAKGGRDTGRLGLRAYIIETEKAI